MVAVRWREMKEESNPGDTGGGRQSVVSFGKRRESKGRKQSTAEDEVTVSASSLLMLLSIVPEMMKCRQRSIRLLGDWSYDPVGANHSRQFSSIQSSIAAFIALLYSNL